MASRVPATVSAMASTVASRPSPCVQGSRLAWCSTSRTSTRPGVPSAAAGTTPAKRFSESVVLRVMTVTSSARAPTNRATAWRDASYSAVDTCERYPAPRCTDAYSGSTSATRVATDSNAGALAA